MRCCFLFCHWLLLLSRYRFICGCLQFLLSKKKNTLLHYVKCLLTHLLEEKKSTWYIKRQKALLHVPPVLGLMGGLFCGFGSLAFIDSSHSADTDVSLTVFNAFKFFKFPPLLTFAPCALWVAELLNYVRKRWPAFPVLERWCVTPTHVLPFGI